MLQRAHSRRTPRARLALREDFGLLPVRFILIGSPRLTGCDRKNAPSIAEVDDSTRVDYFSGTSNILKDIFRTVVPVLFLFPYWAEVPCELGVFFPVQDRDWMSDLYAPPSLLDMHV